MWLGYIEAGQHIDPVSWETPEPVVGALLALLK